MIAHVGFYVARKRRKLELGEYREAKEKPTLSGMSPHVLLERRRFRKVLMTDLTLERPMTCMGLQKKNDQD